MKKLALMMFFALFVLSACGTDRVSINPAGVPQRHTPPVVPEIYEEQEYLVDPLPINVPTAATPNFEADRSLRLSMRHPMTLNPLLNEDITVARILRLIFEPLIILDENLRPTGHLAEIEMSSDFTGARLTIRNDAYWSDGMPVTSDDLIFSVEKLRNAPGNAIYRANVENIASVTRVNTRTVQVYFSRPSICAGIALNFPIIPRHHYNNQTNPRSANNMNPLGNGPFLFESYRPMRNITLKQNPGSFRQLSQIQEIEAVFLPDIQTELFAFDQGRVDAIYLPLTEWVRHHSVRQPGNEISPAMYFEFIGFNFERELLQSLHVRQGMAYAFDANEAIRAVYLNHAVRAATPIHPYSFAAANVQGRGHDPIRAAAFFNIVSADYPLEIIANDDNPQRAAIAQRLAAALNAVGMPAVAEIIPYPEYFARLENGNFDMFIGGVNLAFIPDMQFFFGGGLFPEDPVLEEAFAAVKAAFTEAAHYHAMEQFQRAFDTRLPVISLAFRHSAVLTSPRVSQNMAPAPDNVFGWVNLWRIQ
ncbi:MAG: ABC transporter substrate-binding protein [Firmicutes bacterium]|nr:ABC transporter substrate-binding protein [Bacillota bacterium]